MRLNPRSRSAARTPSSQPEVSTTAVATRLDRSSRRNGPNTRRLECRRGLCGNPRWVFRLRSMRGAIQSRTLACGDLGRRHGGHLRCMALRGASPDDHREASDEPCVTFCARHSSPPECCTSGVRSSSPRCAGLWRSAQRPVDRPVRSVTSSSGVRSGGRCSSFTPPTNQPIPRNLGGTASRPTRAICVRSVLLG